MRDLNVDPFLVLGVGPEATDAEVEASYRALLSGFPPDVAPDHFATLRSAYDALRTPRGRIDALLFHFDVAGDGLNRIGEWLSAGVRRPPALEDVRQLVKESL